MGMSTPFTSPYDWPKQGQDLEGANELVLAYSERRQAVGESPVSLLAPGDSAQDKTIWFAMQEWIESVCGDEHGNFHTPFVDCVNGPIADDKFSRLNWETATLRAAAGLNPNGFTRKYGPSGSLTTAYGTIQRGDVIGPWIFEELQKAFSVLTDSANPNYYPTKWEGGWRQVDAFTPPGQVGQICSDDYNVFANTWAASTWGNDPAGMFYWARGAGGFGFLSYRGRTTSLEVTVPTFRPCSCDIYFNGFGNIDIDGLGYGYRDVDSSYYYYGGYQNMVQSLPESSDAVRAFTGSVGDIDASVVSVMGWGCPYGPPFPTAECYLCFPWQLLKWNFTNA